MARSAQRWHQPGNEASVRQTFDEAGVVTTTRMRVPDGEIESTVWVALSDDGVPTARVNIANRSKLPVAVAVMLSGGDVAGQDCVPSATALPDAIQLGQVRAVAFDRVSRALVAAADLDSLIELIHAEDDSLDPASADSNAGTAAAAAVFPVTQNAILSVAISLRPGVDAVAPSALPSADSVTAGWGAHLGRGVRFVTGDKVVDASLSGARRRLLVAAGDGIAPPQPGADSAHHSHLRGVVGLALARWGFNTEAIATRDMLAVDLDLEAVDGRADAGVASAWLLTAEAVRRYSQAEPPKAEEILHAIEVIDHATRRPRRRSREFANRVGLATANDPFAVEHTVWAEAAIAAGAASLSAMGQTAAANELSDRARRLRAVRRDAGSGIDVEELVGALGWWSGDPARAEGSAPILSLDVDDAMATCLALLALPRRFVVSNRAGFDVIAPPVPGGNWEIHELPTRHGPVSLAVRWHGARPALLWDHDATTLMASTFDPNWSDLRPSGEALLEV